MIEIEVNYEGDLHCTAKHLPSGAEIPTDAPIDNHGRGEAFSPTDLVAAALGTCMATIMAIAGQKHGLDLKGVRVMVRKQMSANPPRRIARLEVDYFVPLAADHPQREALEKATLACPVLHSLHPEMEQKIQFYWEG
jgi:putative redox protein